ncbi:sulfotransferase [Candidatus Pelagibacter sp. RS39]|uniref:sulfotransferase n=1 Tax=Candidatus Pelagibacter sp. RS39 TaxID=1977864 RepID=UPI000A16AA4E|nr:sulfotransferase [Candidatus Pelagibacter sp. RS39]ARJ47732.1 hypothetical protein B5L73_02770 [Candidatus Pelagibacter sp. RS39]
MKNYNFIQRFLHDFVLSKKLINKSLFELEKIFYLKKYDLKHQSHIFITGLPRSGTTSLLNFIYSSGEYASLTYENVPFVLSPNLSKLYNKSSVPLKERLHKDDIYFDNSSPEAFDEIFFNNDELFIKDELSNYINLIIQSKKKNKYLSKNNLNFKRIDLILSILPNSFFLIPIREPLQHSFSLMNQHFNFCKLQKNNDFIRRYMNYLGHNEFGLEHKSWNKPILYNEFQNINYWLEQWFIFYDDIYKKYKLNNKCLFIKYEKLSDDFYIENLLKKLNLIKENNINLGFFKNKNKEINNLEYDKELYEKAKLTYEKF